MAYFNSAHEGETTLPVWPAARSRLSWLRWLSRCVMTTLVVPMAQPLALALNQLGSTKPGAIHGEVLLSHDALRADTAANKIFDPLRHTCQGAGQFSAIQMPNDLGAG